MCVARTAARRRRQMRLDKRYGRQRTMPKNLSGRAKLAFQNLTRTPAGSK
jgi:hypothetical protein